MPCVWLGMNPLLAYCGAQIASLALGVLYIGTPTHHTHLITLILTRIFGENWDGRPDALAEPKVSLTLLGHDIHELLDLNRGPFVPEANLHQPLDDIEKYPLPSAASSRRNGCTGPGDHPVRPLAGPGPHNPHIGQEKFVGYLTTHKEFVEGTRRGVLSLSALNNFFQVGFGDLAHGIPGQFPKDNGLLWNLISSEAILPPGPQ
jgi:hypothetical protein